MTRLVCWAREGRIRGLEKQENTSRWENGSSEICEYYSKISNVDVGLLGRRKDFHLLQLIMTTAGCIQKLLTRHIGYLHELLIVDASYSKLDWSKKE